MIEPILQGFWGAWLLLILLGAFRVFGFSFARRRQDRLWKRKGSKQRPLALIVPVKGFDLKATPRFFDSIFSQDYRDYRVIVCFESWDDPVALWLREHLEVESHHPVWVHPDPTSGLRSVTLVCAGLAQNEGQKVHNQRAAFSDLTGDDAIVAFADSDILCGSDWLTKLAGPINSGTHTLSTTYRWLVPKRPTLPNQLASVINASIATQGGAEWKNVLWGGSMALAREAFDAIDVPNLVAGSLNDDLRISKAAKAAGNRVAYVRSLILPTTIDFTWGTFLEFAKRQYTQVKFFSPILYTGANFILGFYVLGVASIVAALVYGYFWAWIPVAAAYVIDQFRTLARQQIYLSLYPDHSIRQRLFAASWLEHMLTPFWMCLHWLILISTWTQNRITWAGVSYRILSKSKTRILSRAKSTATLPAGAPGLAMMGSLRDLSRRGATEAAPPIEPVAVPETELTHTLAEEATEEVLVTPAASPALSEDTSKTPGPVSATRLKDLARVVSHPGAESAIVPLSVTFHERIPPVRLRPKARERGSLSAVEAALAKTRAQRPSLFPTPAPAPSQTSAPVATPAPQRAEPIPSSSISIRRVLSAPERAKQRTRQERGTLPHPTSLRPARERLAPKPRAERCPGALQRRILSTPIPFAAAPAIQSAPPAARSNGSRPVARQRSLAARRPLGAPNAFSLPSRGFPARSARPEQAAKTAMGVPCRPVNRRGSGRC